MFRRWAQKRGITPDKIRLIPFGARRVKTIATGMGRPGEAPAPARDRNYRSKQTLFGLPLVHVAWGIDPATGRPRVAKGIVALGPVAYGVTAVGFSAWGLCPCGLVAGGFWATGLFAVGFWVVGLAAAGFHAVGLLALGSWHTVGLVVAGPSPIGLERIVIGKGTVGVLFEAAFLAAWLMHRLIRTIGSAAAPAASSGSRPVEAAQSGSSQPPSRPWALIVVAALFIASGCATVWEIAHDFPRHSYDFNLGVLALPIGVGLLRRRPWWRLAALAALWFCFAAILVAAGLALTGHMLPSVTVKLLGLEVTGPARI